MEKNRPICPECKEPKIVLFTPPKKMYEGQPHSQEFMQSGEYVDWDRAHLYCANGTTNCKYTAHLLHSNDLTT
jgi:hypothetical protein